MEVIRRNEFGSPINCTCCATFVAREDERNVCDVCGCLIGEHLVLLEGLLLQAKAPDKTANEICSDLARNRRETIERKHNHVYTKSIL
jgi:hypothetical protein